MSGSGPGYDLLAVHFLDANIGTVGAAMGRLFRTTDGGTTWAQQTSGTY